MVEQAKPSSLENELILAELQVEQKGKGSSLLRVVAEHLIDLKVGEFVLKGPQDKQYIIEFPLQPDGTPDVIFLSPELCKLTGYFMLLVDLTVAETAAITGEDPLEILKSRFKTLPPATAPESETVTATRRRRAQRLAQLLEKDKSGFLVVDTIGNEWRRKVGRRPTGSLKLFLEGIEEAARDYKELYLLGAQAGLGPLPEERPTSE